MTNRKNDSKGAMGVFIVSLQNKNSPCGGVFVVGPIPNRRSLARSAILRTLVRDRVERGAEVFLRHCEDVRGCRTRVARRVANATNKDAVLTRTRIRGAWVNAERQLEVS